MNLAPNDTCITIPQPAREPTAEQVSWLETRARLRAALAASVAESLRLRGEARAFGVTDPERHELHLRRRQVGLRTRHILLALACHRGRPYARVEPCTHDRLVNTHVIGLRLAGVSRVPVVPGPERDAYDAADRRVTAWLKAGREG